MEKFSVFFMITQTLLNWVLESQALLRRLDRTTQFLEKINRNFIELDFKKANFIDLFSYVN